MVGPGMEREREKLGKNEKARIADVLHSVEKIMRQQDFKTDSLQSATVEQYLMRHADAKRIELKMGKKKIIITRDESGYHVEDSPLSKEELETTKRWHEGYGQDPASWDPSGWVYGYAEIQFEHFD